MTAPSKVDPAVHARAAAAGPFRSPGRPRKFPVSDGAPVEIVETGVSLMARLASLGCRVTIRPALGVCSYVPHLPWPFGLLDFVSRAFVPTADTVRATIGLPNADAQLVRAPGVLPADGNRRVVLYMHGGAFLTCGVNSHSRIAAALSKYADSPVLVVNYRLIPKHSVGMAVDGYIDPMKYVFEAIGDDVGPRAKTVLSALDQRSRAFDALDEIEKTSIDYYATMRSLSRQRRADEIRNGESTKDQLSPTYSKGEGSDDMSMYKDVSKVPSKKQQSMASPALDLPPAN